MPEASQQGLDAQRLDELLNPPGCRQVFALNYHASCASTNAECLQASRHASLVVADHQSAGRGRRGNDWHSPAAGNIYLSLGVQLNLASSLLGLVSLQAGVSVAHCLHQRGYTGVRLKWPNDLMLEGRKLGGILIETRPRSATEFFLAIGLGLNSSADVRSFDAIDRPVASLGNGAIEIDRERLIAGLAQRILADVTRLNAQRVDALIECFLALDEWLGQAVSVHTRSDKLHGIYEGIERDGQIRLRLEDDSIRRFAAADISLRGASRCC
jgi:BirA family biotin operon repressor/biotin-[acetyl-CoA-carboxylase] ligase